MCHQTCIKPSFWLLPYRWRGKAKSGNLRHSHSEWTLTAVVEFTEGSILYARLFICYHYGIRQLRLAKLPEFEPFEQSACLSFSLCVYMCVCVCFLLPSATVSQT